MLMVIFSVAILVGTTLVPDRRFHAAPDVGLRVSLALALISLLMVAIAENGRVPIDNPATHLELTMVHEAMVLEYSGRHLALIEAAAMLKLVLYMALISCIFVPWGIAEPDEGQSTMAGLLTFVLKLATVPLRRVRNRHREDAGVPLRRVPWRRPAAQPAGRHLPLCLDGIVGADHAQHSLRHSPPAPAPCPAQLRPAVPAAAVRVIKMFAIQSAALAGSGLARLYPGRAPSLRHGGAGARHEGHHHPGGAATGSSSG